MTAETVELRKEEVTPAEAETVNVPPYSKSRILKKVLRPAFGADARFQTVDEGRGLALIVRHTMTGEQYPLVTVNARAQADVRDLPWLVAVFAMRAHGFDLVPFPDRVELVPWQGKKLADENELKPAQVEAIEVANQGALTVPE